MMCFLSFTEEQLTLPVISTFQGIFKYPYLDWYLLLVLEWCLLCPGAQQIARCYLNG